MNFANVIMKDGSRYFADLPERTPCKRLRDHIARLPGVGIKRYMIDPAAQVWLDFTYSGHAFTVNNRAGNYLFFVQSPRCPDNVLQEIIVHCARITGVR